MIRPTIIWALDESSASTVESWYVTLSGDQKRFIAIASSWEDVRDQLREFNRVETAEELLELGVGQVGEGTWSSIVMVAYGMGDEACSEWASVEERLDSLQREVVRLERHRVILARHERHEIQSRIVRADGLRAVPWLLSDRTDRRQVLGDEAFQNLFNRLLTVISMCFRKRGMQAETPEGHFFRSAETGLSVKLLGTPEVALDEVVRQVARDCAAQTVYTAMYEARQKQFSPFMSPRRIGSFVDDVARGKRTVQELEETVFGSNGLARLSCGELVAWGGKHADHLHGQFVAKVNSWRPSRSRRSPSRSGCMLGPLLMWLGFTRKMREESADETSTSITPELLHMEFESFLAALEESRTLLHAIKEWVHRHRPSEDCHVPRSHRGRWLGNFKSRIEMALGSIWRDAGDRDDAIAIVKEFVAAVTDDFDRDLIQFIVDGAWQNTHPQTKKLSLMDKGSFYVYSGCVLQGQSIPEGGGIVREDGPTLDTSMFGRVKFWRGGPAEMLLASKPIEIDNLEW